jgi:hypothetical protein
MITNLSNNTFLKSNPLESVSQSSTINRAYTLVEKRALIPVGKGL